MFPGEDEICERLENIIASNVTFMEVFWQSWQYWHSNMLPSSVESNLTQNGIATIVLSYNFKISENPPGEMSGYKTLPF